MTAPSSWAVVCAARLLLLLFCFFSSSAAGLRPRNALLRGRFWEAEALLIQADRGPKEREKGQKGQRVEKGQPTRGGSSSNQLLLQEETAAAVPTDTAVPLESQAPESLQALANYSAAQPTPQPAMFNGVFCRGAACNYRRAPLAPLALLAPTLPPIPAYDNSASQREFCRGKDCPVAPAALGHPADGTEGAFVTNCAHLFSDVATTTGTSIPAAAQALQSWCSKRAGYLERGMCGDYASVLVMALSPFANEPSQGGVATMCQRLFMSQQSLLQAMLDLKLVRAALPDGRQLALAAASSARGGGQFGGQFGGGGAASMPTLASAVARLETVSPRDRARLWADHWAKTRHQDVTILEGNVAGAFVSGGGVGALLQRGGVVGGVVGGSDRQRAAESPRSASQVGLPRYEPLAGVTAADARSRPVGVKKYVIAPGSPDGVVPPAEVDGDLFEHCQAEFAEITLNFAQTGIIATEMTKSWCAWRSAVANWTVVPVGTGRPDWTFRNCSNMESLVAFALRHRLEQGNTPHVICRELFKSTNAIRRVSALVDDAWSVAARGAGATAPDQPSDPAALQALQAAAQAYANATYGKMRRQADASAALNKVKMEANAFAAPAAAPDAASAAPVLLREALNVRLDGEWTGL